jgi:hypothetical protein
MKLNNENFWITGEQFESGESLYEVDILDIYDHKQSTIYYKSGIPEIDKLFGDKGYVKQGYVSTMLAQENGVSIFFCKYWRDQLEELAVAHIQREKILRFEEVKSQNLEVVKREEAKHKAKYMLKNGAGLVGSLTGVAGEKLGVSANTYNTAGTIYKLYYLDKSQNERCIEMYSAEDFEHSSQLFLNTYFKSVLSQEAKTPVKESSSCFIATACYKDLYAPELIAFRSYRDNVLNRRILGSLLVKLYYKTSPLIYKQLYRSPKMSRTVKIILDKIYRRIQ